MVDNWSESCGITGLELKAGDPVRLALLHRDYAQGKGPASDFGMVTPLVLGLYDGEGGVTADVATPETLARVEMFCNRMSVRVPRDNTLRPGMFGGSYKFWLISEEAFQYLPKLPCQNPEAGATVKARASLRYETLREAIKPYVASEVEDRPADGHAAYAMWLQAVGSDNEGFVDHHDMLSNHVQSKAAAEALLTSDRDSYIVRVAMQETRKKLVSSVNVGLQYEGHKAVSELARFTRRKAISAGFTVAE